MATTPQPMNGLLGSTGIYTPNLQTPTGQGGITSQQMPGQAGSLPGGQRPLSGFYAGYGWNPGMAPGTGVQPPGGMSQPSSMGQQAQLPSQQQQPQGMDRNAFQNRNNNYAALTANSNQGQPGGATNSFGPGVPQQQPQGVPGMTSYGALGANSAQGQGNPAMGILGAGGSQPQQGGVNVPSQTSGNITAQQPGFQYQSVTGGAWQPPANTSPFSPTQNSPYSGTIYGHGDNGAGASSVMNQQGNQIPMNQAMQQGFNPGSYLSQGPQSDQGGQAAAQSFLQNRPQLPRY